MAKKTVTIVLEVANRMTERFQVKSVENSVEYVPGAYLSKSQVQTLIDRKGWKVRIVK